MADLVLTDILEGGIAKVSINRPQARNALTVDTVAALGAAFARLDDDRSVRVVVLTGEGPHFCAGSDLKEMAARGFGCLREPARLRGWAAIEAIRKPMVAAVEGMALGAGLELSLIADFIIAGPTARFGLPELKVGLMPGDGGTQRLPRLIGRGLALKLILTGDLLDAQSAEKAGMAQYAPQGALGESLAIAARIAVNAPVSARLAKRAVNAGADSSLSAGLQLEAGALEQVCGTADAAEGLSAFLEKRPAVFKGA